MTSITNATLAARHLAAVEDLDRCLAAARQRGDEWAIKAIEAERATELGLWARYKYAERCEHYGL